MKSELKKQGRVGCLACRRKHLKRLGKKQANRKTRRIKTTQEQEEIEA